MSNTGREYHQQMVHYLRKRITYANDGEEVLVGVVPAGSIIHKAASGVFVHEVFNAASTNQLDIGTNGGDTSASDDPDLYGTNLALGTLGFVPLDEAVSYKLDKWTKITASVDLTGTAATTGIADVVIAYIPNNDG